MADGETRGPRVHLAGHAHIDPVWLWRWQEGYAEVWATFRSALDRMKDTRGYVLTASSAAFYAWIEEHDPAMFREIRRRVAEGRWELVGGWWVEPDCNMPAGESFARHGLYGQRYFRQRFGRPCRIGFCADSFGHAGTLPKLLAGCGLEAYVFMRPAVSENPNIPELAFTWTGDDGTVLPAIRIHGSYNANDAKDLRLAIEQSLTTAAATCLKDEVLVFYGIGNHGGGPTRALLSQIGRWQRDSVMPELRYSSAEAFVDIARSHRLPRWKGEMQMHAPGCYAAVSSVKTANRGAEQALVGAEMWSAAASTVTGRSPATGYFEAAWRHVLFNQFHDILAGSSIEDAYIDARNQLGAAIHAGEVECNAARQAVSRQIDTRGDAWPLVAFNNQPFVFDGVMETEDTGGFAMAMTGAGAAGRGGARRVLGLADAKGNPVPCQLILPHSVCGRRRFAVRTSIPSLGHTVLRVTRVPKSASKRLLGRSAVRTVNRQLANEWLRLGLDPRGSVTLYDRRAKRNVFSPAGGLPVVIADTSDTWSHGVVKFHKKAGRFRFRRARVLETGPVRGCIEALYTWDRSTLTLQYQLGAAEPFVVVRGKVDWQQQWQMLKLAFPMPFETGTWTAESAHGTVARPTNGHEAAIHRWADISDGRRGLALVNDCKYSCSCEPGELRLTILRSPPYAYHEPSPVEDAEHLAYTDQGIQTFTLALVPHAGDWRKAGVLEIARRVNLPPLTLQETFHGGRLPSTAGYVTCKGRGVMIEALKGAEDGRGLILRAVEWFGRRRKATFELAAARRTWSATFRPHEIKTFRIPASKRGAIREVNMLEEPLLPRRKGGPA